MKNYTFSSVLKCEMRDFLNLRENRGLSSTHNYIMQRLDEFLVEQHSTEKALSATHVDGFIACYRIGRASKTVQTYATFCSQFAKYLNSIGITAFLPDSTKSSTNYVPYIFSYEEINRIFQAADNFEKHTAMRLQMPMLLRLLYGCGLRLGEALRLRLANVDFEAGVLYILNAKGNKDRLVPMDQTLSNLLQQYCKVALASNEASQHMFEGQRKGNQRSMNYVEKCFKQILTAIGIDSPDSYSKRGVCLHCLRHTFAVHSFRAQDKAGVDNYRVSPSLSVYLGHHLLTGTQKYLHMSAENSEDIWEMTSGIAKSIFPEVPK
jgi:Site-specific recombinase XerD